MAHHLVEETQVMLALQAAVPTDELVAVDLAIRATLPPRSSRPTPSAPTGPGSG